MEQTGIFGKLRGFSFFLFLPSSTALAVQPVRGKKAPSPDAAAGLLSTALPRCPIFFFKLAFREGKIVHVVQIHAPGKYWARSVNLHAMRIWEPWQKNATTTTATTAKKWHYGRGLLVDILNPPSFLHSTPLCRCARLRRKKQQRKKIMCLKFPTNNAL